MTLLRVQHLEVRYGDLVGVSDVSLSVKEASIVALLGANGSGKTTTLKAIVGLIAPSAGIVEWNGAPITGLPAFRVVRQGLTLSPEGWHLFTSQTVEQNLLLGATVLNDRNQIKGLLERVYDLFPRLAERRQQRVGTMSGGERQMLAIGRALMSNPKMLMLDEPSLGLAPIITEKLYETILRLHQEGLTILLAEQAVSLALEVAHYAYVLQTGRTVLEGPAHQLANDPAIRRAYLGMASDEAAGA